MRKDGKPVPLKITKHVVGELIEAMKSRCFLPRDTTPPYGLDGYKLPSFDLERCVFARNGVLNLETGGLVGLTPKIFNLHAIGTVWNPDATAPTWQQSLLQWFDGDEEQIRLLQQIFGLFLTTDTSFQKLFMLIGPKRSGKGTIARILGELHGDHMASSSLNALSKEFGLAQVLNKPVAVIPDARLSGRTDAMSVSERLLSISGEDLVSVSRKYLSDWVGKLPTRFLIISNDLPDLKDDTGVLASRFVFLSTKTSFFGREDRTLLQKIREELPGILRWAVDGWRDLQCQGAFLETAWGREAFRQLETMQSPMKVWTNTHLEFGHAYCATSEELRGSYHQWCEQQGYPPGAYNTFGKDFRKQTLTLTRYKRRVRDENPGFVGVRLRNPVNPDNPPQNLERSMTPTTAKQTVIEMTAHVRERLNGLPGVTDNAVQSLVFGWIRAEQAEVLEVLGANPKISPIGWK